MFLAGCVRPGLVTSFAVSLLLASWSCPAPAFPALDKWTAHGGNSQNGCYMAPDGSGCLLYDSAERAGLAHLTTLYCHSDAYYSHGVPPFDFEWWRMDGNQSPNCGPFWWANFVARQPAYKYCPPNSTPNGSTECTCNAGFLEANGSCHGGANNGSSCPVIFNPVNPATGNKFQREPIYAGPHGLNFDLVYNSHDTLPASFGARWRGSFDRSIVPRTTRCALG